MKYKAIFADVDGTLIAPNAHRATCASADLIETVARAKQLGVEFSLSTARSLDWVEGLVKSLNITAPIILDNGARIYFPAKNKYIFETYIKNEQVNQVLPFMQRLNDIVYVVDNVGNNERYQTRLGDKINFQRVVKMMILHLPPEKADIIYKKIKKISVIQATKSISGENPVKVSIHVTSRYATKPKALKFIAKYMGWNLKEIIGIGDSYNDLELLKFCGLKVAMGNATSDIKKIADYIAPSYDNDGVAKTIEKFVLKNI